MNNTFQHPERPPRPLPTAPPYPAHPGQPNAYPPPGTGQHVGAGQHPAAHYPPAVRPPEQANKLNPYGTISLVMMLLMTCIGLANFIFFDWELSIALPTGFTWLGAMGLAIGALFVRGREKITAIFALILGVLIIVAAPLFFILAITFIMWVGGGFA
ncbi:hypothetical protein ACFP6B_06660 [Rothia nasimurium]|uniref:hypothetical protein n=1 Tax=Rothia nasimurium TaxID=85336 RepID=UPI0036088EA4